MKRSVFILLLLLPGIILFSQERKIRNLPNLPGYNTLLCDFHMHTVFSDGDVWPSVRVQEAWHEGIDAIAISDHVEDRYRKKDVIGDKNRSWEIAQYHGQGNDVIVIPATEITKNMPPGHFNALFIKDANPINNDDYEAAIEEAVSQGAFIMWNHPGWKSQQPDTMRWWDEHDYLYEKGWLHGIEVANDHDMYPGAINWARDKNLTFIANSDVHSPINMSFDLENSHRPITLVFANERSIGGVREALFNGRTIAYFENMLMGKEALLKAFFLESVQFKKRENADYISLLNHTEITFEIELTDYIYEDWSRSMSIAPGMEIILSIPPEIQSQDIRVSVKNFYTGSQENLVILLSDMEDFRKK